MTDEPNDELDDPTPSQSLPAVNDWSALVGGELSSPLHDACRSWLMKSPSRDTRTTYARDLKQFLTFYEFAPDDVTGLPTVRPHHVAAWRDALQAPGTDQRFDSTQADRVAVGLLVPANLRLRRRKSGPF